MLNRNREKYNAYMKKYMLEKYHKIRQSAIEYLGGKCVICGSVENLELDHKDHRSKKYDLAKMWSGNQGRYKEELNKCQLLCEDCHIRKSSVDRGFKVAKGNHGTISTYRYCRCELCKKAKGDYYNQTTARTV
jgi:5-methylcytosine-specific restriction endonuclease McrA